MELLVLNTNLEAVFIIDNFESIIWTERYFKYGDFELYTPVTDELLSVLTPVVETPEQGDYYLWLNDSVSSMIIEGVEIDTDSEKGNYLTVSGRSLESMLDRRIIWVQTLLSGNLQTELQRLLNEAIITPSDPLRKIDNFIFELSDDPTITSLTIDTQFTGDNLYTSIQTICESNSIGFRITLTDDNKFKFKLYSGVDRSFGQIDNPYVTFSPKFENLINSNYVESKKTLKSITLVAGEGEGTERKTVAVESPSGGGSGLTRRELYTDARDISSKVDNVTLTNAEYLALLTERGKEKLTENSAVKSFEGEIETNNMYKYGEDFFIGDITQIKNEYGMEARSRVVEFIRSADTSGVKAYPTFIAI